ncbi:MAG: multicopper oxidase domain-containing protein [Vicinamibacterales bacterium]
MTHIERRDLLRLLAASPLAAAAHAAGLLSIDTVFAQSGVAAPDVELELTASPGTAQLLPGAPTNLWRYSARVIKGPSGTVQPIPGSYLGPALRVKRGQRVRVRFRNQLAEPSIVHWHGLDVPEKADGHPRLAVDAGGEYVYDFAVTNRAGTNWYHPHPHMRTAYQAYHGLAGLFLVSDPEEDALGLPSGDGELLFALQDRRFDGSNQLVYASGQAMGGGMGRGRGRGGMRGGGMAQMMETMNGWLGDRMLVSGRVQPTIDVDRRTYRIRLLNGSNARFYKLAWSHQAPFTVIGTDGGLLARPHATRTLTLAPGQRADVLLDLSQRQAGTEVQLQSVGFPAAAVGRAGMMGETSPVPQGAPLVLATLRLSNRQGPQYRAPAQLSVDRFQPSSTAPVRRVPLTFMQMNWLIDGRTFDMEDASAAETVAPGSTHIWEFVNQPNPMGMMMAHPIHMHGRQFRVLSRSGGSENALREGIHDQGWTDTVVVLPGETVRVQVTFSEHPGLYLYHCHILEHEDMGMMRNFRIRG